MQELPNTRKHVSSLDSKLETQLTTNILFMTYALFSGNTVARNGTCYSSTECSDKSGQAAGGCAAG